MSQLSGLINCPNLQTELNTLFTNCDPTKINEGTPLTNFLLSEENTQGVKIGKLTSPGNGKSRIVEVVYSPRLDEASVSDSTGRDECNTTKVIGETSQQYDVGSRYVQDGFLIDPQLLRYKCQENDLYLAEKLQQIIDVVMRKRETVLANSLALNYGNFSEGEPDVTAKIKTVATKFANGGIDTDALENIGTATEYAAYCSKPIVFGGRQMGQYMKRLNAGCCSANAGFDVTALAAQYGMAFIEGYRFDTAFGANGFMTAAIGALQLLEYLEYEGPKGVNYFDAEVYKQMVIMDPRTGARLDLKFNLNCDGKISIFVRSYFKLVYLPNDLFFSTDRLAGVNQVNRFVIDNPS